MGSDSGNGNPPSDQSPDTKFRDWALKTAGAIVGGLGLATWMVIIGSAVIWARFDEAGLPVLQAVSVQPRSETLAQGAQVTILFVLIALAAVSVMYLFDSRKTKSESKEPAEPHKIGWWALGWVVLLAIAAIVWTVFWTDLGTGSVLLLIALAVLLAAAALWMGLNNRKNFWALAGVLFVGIIVFAGVAGFLIVKEEKFVQAVAILRDENDTGVVGFFVAATDEKVYIANAIGPDKPERKPIQAIKLGPEATYSVGPLEDQEDATVRAHSMLQRLIRVREANPPGPGEPEAAEEDSTTGGGAGGESAAK